MENIYLHELVGAVGGEFLLGDPHAVIRAVSIDTRTLHRGDYFFALTGHNFDGHNYLKNASERRAGGLIITRQDADFGNPFPYLPAIIRVNDTTKALGDFAGYYRKKFNIPLVAITGSNGKTTTKEMLSSIMEQYGRVHKTGGNFNNQIGLPLTLMRLESEHRCAVIEMGTSLPGEIKRLTQIASPTAGIITNIGCSHLESLKSAEGVFNEKRVLLDGLPQNGWIVLNTDDPYLSALSKETSVEVVPVSIEKDTLVCAKEPKLWLGKPCFQLHIGKDFVTIQLPVYGKFNIYNALSAAAAAWKLGADLNTIKNGLENFNGESMRMEVLDATNDIIIVNDAYNANPSSMKESIKSFVQSFPDKEKIVVLGDMLELGETSVFYHREIGAFLEAQPLDKIFLFGPAMESAFKAVNHPFARHFVDRAMLEHELKKHITSGTVILFKASRGMRLESTIKLLFSEDRPVII